MVSCLTSYEFAQPGFYLWVILRGRLRASPTVRTEPGSIQRTDKLQFADIAGEHCRQIAAALPIMMKKTAPPVGETAFWCRRVCKPGSVLTAIYLAPQLLTGSSRLLGTVGPTCCPSTALLRDRVYIVKPMLPWAGCALTAPFHPCSADAGRYLSVALVLRFPSAGVTRYPCPVEPGLSSSGSFRFPSAAVQPSLRKYSTPKHGNCQIPLQILFEKGILWTINLPLSLEETEL